MRKEKDDMIASLVDGDVRSGRTHIVEVESMNTSVRILKAEVVVHNAPCMCQLIVRRMVGKRNSRG